MPKILLVIDQGADFNTVISLTDENNNALDVTGYSANAQIRKHYQSANATPFTCNLVTGILTLSMNAATTSSLIAGRHVWDCELRDPTNTAIRLAEGVVHVSPEVTK